MKALSRTLSRRDWLLETSEHALQNSISTIHHYMTWISICGMFYLEVSSEIAVVHKPVPGDILYVSPIKHTNILPFAPLPLLQK